MRCGYLSGTRRTSNGFGWQLMKQSVKLFVFMLVSQSAVELEDCGTHCQLVYRQCAVCYTHFWSTYNQILLESRPRAVSKTSGNTNCIERFNCTVRQRISRLVRETLSFSKKL